MGKVHRRQSRIFSYKNGSIVILMKLSRLLICIALPATLVIAQEPEFTGGRGRGGRGGARGSTREFLGLGPAPDASAAKKGEPLYKQNCAGCHGENARGSQGPNLVRSVSVLHDEKDE